MPQALQSRRPLLRSLQIANLPETRPTPHPPSPPSQPSSSPALPPSTPIPLERPKEQNDDPERRTIRRGVDNELSEHGTHG